jgi:hypothetical protein
MMSQRTIAAILSLIFMVGCVEQIEHPKAGESIVIVRNYEISLWSKEQPSKYFPISQAFADIIVSDLSWKAPEGVKLQNPHIKIKPDYGITIEIPESAVHSTEYRHSGALLTVEFEIVVMSERALAVDKKVQLVIPQLGYISLKLGATPAVFKQGGPTSGRESDSPPLGTYSPYPSKAVTTIFVDLPIYP